MYEKQNGRISDGEITKTPVPYQLSLYNIDDNIGHFCGGVLITLEYGLSTFHCFFTEKNTDHQISLPLEKIFARAGITNQKILKGYQVCS